MAVEIFQSTMPGGVTPVCGRCGVSLCWDLSDEEYEAAKVFWDEWTCERCNGKKKSLREWKENR